MPGWAGFTRHPTTGCYAVIDLHGKIIGAQPGYSHEAMCKGVPANEVPQKVRVELAATYLHFLEQLVGATLPDHVLVFEGVEQKLSHLIARFPAWAETQALAELVMLEPGDIYETIEGTVRRPT
jgi:hypothetical protein